LLLYRTTSAVDPSEAPPQGTRSRLDPFVWIAIWLTLITLVALAFTVSPSSARQGGLYCGAYVTQDVTLRHDLYGCVEGGIIVGRSGVTIDLNGHTITGSGQGDGISAMGVSGVTIKNGAIVNFETGARLTMVSKSRILDTRFSMNTDASLYAEASSQNKFKRITMTENGDGGFRLIGSSNNRIAGSTISGASDSGIILEELSSFNRLVRNKITLAGEGIKVSGGTGNRVFRNTTSYNGGAGVEVSGESINTRVNENQAHFNGADGIFIEGMGTQVNRNNAGCNGGMGIKSTVYSPGSDNVAGGNGDNLGCAGVVCRISFGCGAE
jgi:parallel beta-helix repeat protein